MTMALRAADDEWHWSEFLLGAVLMPMGGQSIETPDGGVAHFCGTFNVPPSVDRIRRTLQEADEIGLDPEATYGRAVDEYRALSEHRRRGHPEWNWPAPAYEDVGPATWPLLTPERLTWIHAVRVTSVLARGRDADRAEWVTALRRILERAVSRGADPRIVYRDAVAEYDEDRGGNASRSPAPDYAEVDPHRHTG